MRFDPSYKYIFVHLQRCGQNHLPTGGKSGVIPDKIVQPYPNSNTNSCQCPFKGVDIIDVNHLPT